MTEAIEQRVNRAAYDNHYCSQCGLHKHDAKTLLKLLKITVRALECIYRFTLDNYARDALKECQKAGWPVRWDDVAVQKNVEWCNVRGCLRRAEEGRGQCSEHDK